MVDLNNFVDWKNVSSIAYKSKKEIINEMKEYFLEHIDSLNGKFEQVVPCASIHLNCSYPEYRYYGSQRIMETIKRAIEVSEDKIVVTYLSKLISILDELLNLSLHTDEEKISQLFERVSSLKERIREYYSLKCKGCSNKVCMDSIQKVLEELPFRQLLWGLFHADPQNNDSIIKINLQSISISSKSQKEFNSQVWSTLAHETFHSYHYFLCRKQNPDPYHWFQEDFRHGEEGGQDDMIFDFFEGDRPRIQENHHRVMDLLSGPPSDASIVKESLASYYEYYSNKYGMNISVPESMKVGEKLYLSWKRVSVVEWPYSGAKIFLNDANSIDGKDSLFKKILYNSIDDWENACGMIVADYNF